MKTGKVKFFNSEKRFGFITEDDVQPGSKDIFVHGSALKPGISIKENDRVSFDVEDKPKGISAINVQLITE
jgi:CspA family cold shock protein